MQTQLPPRVIIFILILFNSFLNFSQNLLNTSSWTIGSGSVTGYSQNGNNSENIREMGNDHLGRRVVLWKAVPDASSNADGGWNSSYINIDNTKRYRLAIWIKKTNSDNGTTYFGPQQYQSNTALNNYTILNLNNSVNNNPYFWVGDLPILNRWYLLVGFVHSKNDTSMTHNGAIYDGVTGEFVQTIYDFKFASGTSILRHRAYLYYDTNQQDRQYFVYPRVDLVNGNEPTINELLETNENSRLIFAYDDAGNQKQRFYCPVSGCTLPTPPAGRTQAGEELAKKEVLDDSDSHEKFNVRIFPNPTTGIASMSLESEENNNIAESIIIYDASGSVVFQIQGLYKRTIELNLMNLPSGLYIVHAHLENGKSATKKLIKN